MYIMKWKSTTSTRPYTHKTLDSTPGFNFLHLIVFLIQTPVNQNYSLSNQWPDHGQVLTRAEHDVQEEYWRHPKVFHRHTCSTRPFLATARNRMPETAFFSRSKIQLFPKSRRLLARNLLGQQLAGHALSREAKPDRVFPLMRKQSFLKTIQSTDKECEESAAVLSHRLPVSRLAFYLSI